MTAKTFTASTGALCRNEPGAPIVRPLYRRTVRDISNTQDLRATLRAGRYTSLGSYPLYFLLSDGGALCFDCARKEYRHVSEAMRERSNNGWRITHCDVNYEDADLFCDNCATRIESAYAEPAKHWYTSSDGKIELELTLDDAKSGSHQGQCDDDIEGLRRVPYVKAQLDKLDPADVRNELRGYGAWDTTELADDEQNLNRLLWLACGNIREEHESKQED